MRLNEIKNSEEYIWKFCDEFEIEKYYVKDGLLNVPHPVFLNNSTFEELPVKFGTVQGDFTISNSKITTLKGVPHTVKGTFNVSFNPNLTSLQYSPTDIEISYDCSINENLTSFEGITQDIKGYVNATSCRNLNSFKGIGKIGNGLYLEGSLDKLPGLLRILKIEHLSKVVTSIKKLDDILNRYLTEPLKNRDIMECQEEMIDAGFERWAKL
jgi:hypothetical protein